MPLESSPTDDAQLHTGIQQFNQADYYACHDTLEAIWMEAEVPEKAFFQGILQLAVALYHLGNHNWQGTAILLGEGIRRLEPFEPKYRGVDVTPLLDCASAWLEAVQQLGAEQVVRLAEALQQSQLGQATTLATITLPQWQIHYDALADQPTD
jgi:predicted metal-dependent hydrolase